MKKPKYLRERQKRRTWLWILAAVAVALVVVLVLIPRFNESSGEEEPTIGVTETAVEIETVAETETAPQKEDILRNNPFLMDLSFSGMITTLEDAPCFVADQMYSMELDGESYEAVNTFLLQDYNLLAWAEQRVIVRASGVEKAGEDFVMELQYLVADDVVISTPFTVFHYPEEWADHLSVVHSYSTTSYQLDFWADFDETQVQLFSVVMGETEGTPVGKLTDSMDAVTMVYVEHYEINYDQYTDEQQNYLYGMMDGMNYLLEMLRQEAEFSGEY